MFCTNCGKEVSKGVNFCPSCGEKIENNAEDFQKPENNNSVSNSERKDISPKNRTIAALLAFFLGGLGAHRFYVGKAGTAILTILLTGCFGLGCIWAFIDLIFILCGNFKDKDEKLILDWNIQ